MAKFTFKLEVVLEQRRGVERAKQLAVAELERQRMEVEGLLQAYQRDLSQEKADLREHLTSDRGEVAAHVATRGVDLRAVRMQANAALHVVARAQRAVFRLAGVHQRIDAARLELIEATTRRRAIEVLKERRLEAWRWAQNRAENATLDELAIIRASRQEETA